MSISNWGNSGHGQSTSWQLEPDPLGFLIVLLRALVLVQTTDVYDFGFLLDSDPSLSVLLGVYTLVRSGFRNLFGPLVVIVVAGA